MNRQSLISLTTAALAVVTTSAVNAQEAPAKQNSIGPAIEFSGGGTSFGIKGKIGVSPQISVRPMILFGYTPTVSSTTFGQALTSGFNNLTASVAPNRNQQIASLIAANSALTTETAAALLDKKDPTPAEKEAIAKAQAPVARYTQLTDEQKIAFSKSISDVKLTDRQVDAFLGLYVDIAKTAPDKRTPEQKVLLDQFAALFGGNKFDPTVDELRLQGFAQAPTLTAREQLKTVIIAAQALSPKDDATLLSRANGLFATLDAGIAAQKAVAEAQKGDPNYKPTALQQEAIARANASISVNSTVFSAGFTPGSGTAYGLAVTYDFQSADSKLSGYVGPRVMFANGSSKIANFDTSTSETSIGLLVGADYAISSDFLAGLSATYNFSKSGTLSVTGPGGFNGSAPVSGSNLDFGVNFSYRF